MVNQRGRGSQSLKLLVCGGDPKSGTTFLFECLVAAQCARDLVVKETGILKRPDFTLEDFAALLPHRDIALENEDWVVEFTPDNSQSPFFLKNIGEFSDCVVTFVCRNESERLESHYRWRCVRNGLDPGDVIGRNEGGFFPPIGFWERVERAVDVVGPMNVVVVDFGYLKAQPDRVVTFFLKRLQAVSPELDENQRAELLAARKNEAKAPLVPFIFRWRQVLAARVRSLLPIQHPVRAFLRRAAQRFDNVALVESELEVPTAVASAIANYVAVFAAREAEFKARCLSRGVITLGQILNDEG